MVNIIKSPWSPLLYALIYLLASSLLAYGPWDKSKEFWSSPDARVWHTLLALQVTVWVSSIAAVIPEFRGKEPIWPSKAGPWLPLVLSTLVALPMAALPLIIVVVTGNSFLPATAESATKMPYFETKMSIMSVGGAVAAMVHVFGIFCVHAKAIEGTTTGNIKVLIERYKQRQAQLKRFLGSAAVIIGVATLSSGALRNLINGTITPTTDKLPAALPMAYGIYFTVLLAGIYLPVQRAQEDTGQMIASRLIPDPPLEIESAKDQGKENISWKEWSEDQQAVRAFLGLNEGALKNLQEGIAVLAPLIAGISSLLLETKT